MTSTAQRLLNPPGKAYLILFILIFSAGVGPITIRAAQQAAVPSLYIIAARLLLAAVALTPISLKRYKSELGRLRVREWLLALASGFFLALNLLLLFLSLEYTSVLVTNVLRGTMPLWVIGLEIIFLGAAFSRQVWLGLLLAFAGALLVGFGSAGAIEPGRNPGLGAFLALCGAVSIGLYLLIGRRLSRNLPSLAYSWLVFSAAALIALIAVFVTGTPLAGYSLIGYMWVLVVTFVTQVLGHLAMNMSLHYFPATYVSLALQLAVVVSAALALILFNEIPSLLQIIGSAAILAGVTLVNWR
jgi:drug/metabolite transporter (DMT)-like permease